jgi:metal-responsive CopG/Arc/MetJ family transcriptional regulator
MQTIQVVLEDSLLRAADRAVRRLKINRSAFIRAALRHHLKGLETLEREKQDREGYRRRPAELDDMGAWDEAAAWPER